MARTLFTTQRMSNPVSIYNSIFDFQNVDKALKVLILAFPNIKNGNIKFWAQIVPKLFIFLKNKFMLTIKWVL